MGCVSAADADVSDVDVISEAVTADVDTSAVDVDTSIDTVETEPEDISEPIINDSDSADLQDQDSCDDVTVVEDTVNSKKPLKANALGAEPDGTFSDLSTIISNAQAGSTITLDRNYVFNSRTDSTEGVSISKAITIDGAGFIIDGKNAARVLRIATNRNVILKNLILINGNSSNAYGGAIYCSGGTNLTITNCSFDNNTAGTENPAYGGAIYMASGILYATHCEFYNNHAYAGGAIFQTNSPTVTIKGSAFVNNTADVGANSFLRSGAESKFDYSENWWGTNYGAGYTVYSERYGAYYSNFDYYIATEILTSTTTIEVNMVLDSGKTPSVQLEPRHAIVSNDATTCNTTESWVPEPFTIEFTTSTDAYINVTIDNQHLVLKVFAGENKKNISVLRVEVEDVILPTQPIAYVYSDIDGIYNLTIGTEVIPVTVTGGVGTYQFTNLNVGKYTVIISRVDDPVYKTIFNTTDFEVKKYETQLVINTETPNPTFGTDVTITHTLTPEEATGTITYFVDGSETGTQLSITDDFVLSGLSAGEHTVVAKYSGDLKYAESASNTLVINVAKVALDIAVPDVTVNYPNKGTVKVTANNDGEYTINVNGVPYSVTVLGGEGSFDVNEVLSVGNYEITWDIPASENYTGATGSANYIVLNAAPDFEISGEAVINYGQTNTITHTINDDAEGTIAYTINGTSAGSTNVGESFTTAVLNAGHYVLVATYSGDVNYGSVSKSLEFDVLPIDVIVTVENVEVYYPSTGTVYVTSTVPGTYVITINSKDYEVIVGEDGTGSKLIPDVLEVGSYDISVSADLGINYNPVDIANAATYSVKKPATALEITVAEFTYGDDASATLTLKQGNTPLEGKEIVVTIDATQTTVTTNSQGVATVSLSSLNAGDHNIVAIFVGDENYALAYDIDKVTVNKATPDLTVTANAINYGQDAEIAIALDGVNDEKITGVVKVTINEKTYDVAVTNGVGTLTITGLNVNEAGYAIAASFAGNDNYKEASYNEAKQIVNKADATVTVSADKDNIKFGETVTFTNTLVPADATGDVVYYVDGTAITGDSISTLSVGEHTVVAKYAGDDNYNADESEALTITVAKADASVTVSADKTEIKYGETVTLTTSLLPADATGDVTIYVDGEVTGATLSDLSVGTHTVVAKYAGDNNYSAAESEALTITVAKADASVTVAANADQVTYGETFTFTSEVSPEGATGDVVYYVDGTAITGDSISTLSVGEHTVVAKYAGNENYTAAESAAKTITVTKATPTITITSEPVTYPNDAIVDLVLTGVNNAALPGVTVRVTINGTTYAVVTDDQGKASLAVKGLDAGTYDIAAVSVADNTYNEATYEGTAKVVVNKADTTVSVSADKTDIKYGETVTLTTGLVPADATGDVTIYVDGEVSGATLSDLSVGTHTVVAKYAGDNNYNADESEALTITVAKADATVTVSADKTDIKYGETVTLTTDLVPADATGDVTIYVDGEVSGATLSDLSVGTHTVVAKYAGDENYNADESEALTITVAKADATVTVSADKTEIKYGETITLTTDLVPADATGDVTIYVDGEVSGATLSDLSVGTHTVVAKYAGDENYTAAESEALTITVNKADVTIVVVPNATSVIGGESISLDYTIDPATATAGTVTYYLDGNAVEGSTLSNLAIGTHTVTAKYTGDSSYADAESAPVVITVGKLATEISGEDITVYATVGDTIEFTLKDSNGKVLAGKEIVIAFNGVNTKVTTDSNGIAKLDINMANKGTYSISASFAGDDSYEASFASYNVVVKAKATKLTVSNTEYSLSGSKYLTATLTAGGEPLANKVVTFQINGKTYTGRSNANGEIKVPVALTAKKTYSVVVSFAGDSTYGTAVATYKLKVTS